VGCGTRGGSITHGYTRDTSKIRGHITRRGPDEIDTYVYIYIYNYTQTRKYIYARICIYAFPGFVAGCGRDRQSGVHDDVVCSVGRAGGWDGREPARASAKRFRRAYGTIIVVIGVVIYLEVAPVAWPRGV